MVYRRRVVEDRNPMGPILAVLATLVVLLLAWMLLFRDGFGGGDDEDATVTQTPAEQQEGEGEAEGGADVDVNLPGGTAEGTADVDTGDEPATGGDATTGDQQDGTGGT
ncbi:MAG TPA: hypothetical protein VHJ78_04970 [Actinomycetota bacterium]|nr:hypothetical protein [Actinomycetota bacterium]